MIDADTLKEIALSFPKATKKPHFDATSFRIDAPRGKIFCTLPPHEEFANVFLSVEQQQILLDSDPELFFRVPNKLGDKGATSMRLAHLDEGALRSALTLSWRHAAPRSLHKLLASRE